MVPHAKCVCNQRPWMRIPVLITAVLPRQPTLGLPVLCLCTQAGLVWLQDMIINQRSRTAGSGAFKDVFDQPEAEPDCLFVNPFACSIDPMQWQELQVSLLHLSPSLCTGRLMAIHEPQGLDLTNAEHSDCFAVSTVDLRLQEYAREGLARNMLLEDHLLAAGLAAPASAVNWLSPAQLAAVQQVLTFMEERFDFEAAAWSLDDMLRRARRANERLDIPLRRPASSW